MHCMLNGGRPVNKPIASTCIGFVKEVHLGFNFVVKSC